MTKPKQTNKKPSKAKATVNAKEVSISTETTKSKTDIVAAKPDANRTTAKTITPNKQKKTNKPKRPNTLKRKHGYGLYLLFSLLVLISTTIYWSILGARYHFANADQLVNSLLFNNLESARNALLPNAHSFLIKWPLFFIGGVLGAKASILTVLTVTTTLITVCSLAYILYRIEKRPAVLGTIYLVIGSFLLLIPTAPYAGALLPVNMAMVATRNIEYIVFITALYYVIRSQNSWRSKTFLLSVFLFAILFASDKLFVSLSIGGALGVMLVYSIARKWKVVQIGQEWLLASLSATVVSIGILWAISRLHIVTIVSGGSSFGPYGLIHSLREFIKGTVFAILGLLTNFGANPAYDALLLRDIPTKIKSHLTSFSGPGMLINLIFFGLGLILTILLIRATLITKLPKNKPLRFAPVMSIMLISSSVVALAVFILSNHYYPVDSRYLAICFFAIIIASATYISSTRPNQKLLLNIGLMVSFITLVSVIGANQTYNSDIKPLQQYTERNKAISMALKNHKVTYVVGDYWRVVPIAQATNSTPTPSPLANCTTYRNALTSKNWQPNLTNTSFAYILSFDKSATDFPHCSLDEITKAYGKPTSTVVIAGTPDKPAELLLLFDKGKLSSATSQQNSILPVSIENIASPDCTTTNLNIVAHQDDDLLFMNPDIQKAISEGACVRTVYLTAGDAGQDSFYWLKREKGPESAYSQMAGIPKTDWVERTIKLDDKQFAIMAVPKSNIKLSLVFLRLPDGNVGGQGFRGAESQNISKLYDGQISTISSVDKLSVYTKPQLEQALTKLIALYKPNVIRTQSVSNNNVLPDHADHIGVAKFTRDAYQQYASLNSIDTTTVSLSHYYGYPVRELPNNVDDTDLHNKTEAFLAYSQNDVAVCHSISECENTSTYWGYLNRQYVLN